MKNQSQLVARVWLHRFTTLFNACFLDTEVATSARSARDELLLRLLALLDVVVDESFSHVRLLCVVLANEDGLHAEFVEALQVAAARLSLLLT